MKQNFFTVMAVLYLGLSDGNMPVLQEPSNNQNMIHEETKTDKDVLSDLNHRFIQNFIKMDTAAHNEIIHQNFVCINGNGTISDHKEYMKGWANGYTASGYSKFWYTDEDIRIFGDVALVRAKTVYTKNVDGKEVSGNSLYTDTYIKENGRWWCVQAQITPVK